MRASCWTADAISEIPDGDSRPTELRSDPIQRKFHSRRKGLVLAPDPAGVYAAFGRAENDAAAPEPRICCTACRAADPSVGSTHRGSRLPVRRCPSKLCAALERVERIAHGWTLPF